MTEQINPSIEAYEVAKAPLIVDLRQRLMGHFKAGENIVIAGYAVHLLKDLDYYQVVTDADPTKFVGGHILLDLEDKGYFTASEEGAEPLETDDDDDHASLIDLTYHDRTPGRAAVDTFAKEFPLLIDLLIDYRGSKLLFDEDRLLPVRVLLEVMARMTNPAKEYPEEVANITDIPVKTYPQAVYDRLLASAKVLAGPDGGPPSGKVEAREVMSIGQTMLYHEIHIIRAEKIAKYGYTMQASETADGQFFLYTIGLDKKANCELLITGNVGYENAASIVAQTAKRFMEGEKVDLTQEFTLPNFTLRKKPVNGVVLDDINDDTPPTHIRFKFKEWTHLGKETEEERQTSGYELELIFDKYTRAVAYKTGTIVQILVGNADNKLPGEEGYVDKSMNQELQLFPKKG